jgi:LDH2 family malate/lactate/ureidoglycolate dehydrogenase
MAERLEKGIPVDEQSWDTICTAAIKAGMSESEVKVYT